MDERCTRSQRSGAAVLYSRKLLFTIQHHLLGATQMARYSLSALLLIIHTKQSLGAQSEVRSVQNGTIYIYIYVCEALLH